MLQGRAGSAGRSKPSLRTEFLFNLAVLAAGALVLAVWSAALAPLLGHGLLGFACSRPWSPSTSSSSSDSGATSSPGW